VNNPRAQKLPDRNNSSVVFAITACRYATATGAVNRINLFLVNSVKSLISVDPPLLQIRRSKTWSRERDYLLGMFRIIKTWFTLIISSPCIPSRHVTLNNSTRMWQNVNGKHYEKMNNILEACVFKNSLAGGKFSVTKWAMLSYIHVFALTVLISIPGNLVVQNEYFITHRSFAQYYK